MMPQDAKEKAQAGTPHTAGRPKKRGRGADRRAQRSGRQTQTQAPEPQNKEAYLARARLRWWPNYPLVNAREILGLYGWEFAIAIDIHTSMAGTLKYEQDVADRELSQPDSLQGILASASHAKGSTFVPAARLENFKSSVVASRMKLMAEALELKSVARHFETLDIETTGDTAITYANLLAWFEQLKQRLLEELEDRWFLFVGPERVELFRNPLGLWQTVPDKFPSSKDEIISASHCLALGQGTACVFHAMRIVEYGLDALADDIGVNKTTLATKPWGSVLNEIEQIIPAKIKAITDPIRKKQDAEFYHWAAHQFEHFREAWRDRVSHKVRSYNSAAADGVLTGVRAFMVKLAERGLQETP